MARWATTTPPAASQLARVRIGAHPTDMVWRDGGQHGAEEGEAAWAARLFVAAANTNNVYAVGVSAGQGAERGGDASTCP